MWNECELGKVKVGSWGQVRREATVVAYGAIARQAGQIKQKPKGVTPVVRDQTTIMLQVLAVL